MKKQVFILFLILTIIAACNKSSTPSIYGKWQVTAIGLPGAQGLQWQDQRQGISPSIIQFSTDHSYIVFEDIVPFSYKGNFDIDVLRGIINIRQRKAPYSGDTLPDDSLRILSLTNDLLWLRDGSGTEFRYQRYQ